MKLRAQKPAHLERFAPIGLGALFSGALHHRFETGWRLTGASLGPRTRERAAPGPAIPQDRVEANSADR